MMQLSRVAAAAAARRQPPSWHPACATITTSNATNFYMPTRKREEENHPTQQIRTYHATTPREILPLVGLAVVGLTVRYSYKALQRMDEDWKEYEIDLAEYEAKYGPIQTNTPSSTSTSSAPNTNTNRVVRDAKDGVLAVDLGTRHVRIAHYSAKNQPNNNKHANKHANKNEHKNMPKVVEDREGRRCTSNAILFEQDN
eukprot:scaffold230637_cov34-Attheya_sp.AAC.1